MDLRNTVIYSDNAPLIDSWNRLVPILRELGVKSWNSDKPIEHDELLVRNPKNVILININNKAMTASYDFAARYYSKFMTVEELTFEDGINNFFFESIIKKVLKEESDWQWTEEITEYNHYIPNVGDRFIYHGYADILLTTLPIFDEGDFTDEIFITEIRRHTNDEISVQFIDEGSYRKDPTDVDVILLSTFRKLLEDGTIEVLELQ